MEAMWRFARQDEGAETVEYALVLGLMALVAVAAITAAGTSVAALWDRLEDYIGTIPIVNP
jgi:Flp pilus assembly pilin Flp